MQSKLLFLYPSAIPLVDFVLEDSGQGVNIKNWNTSKLGEKPTESSILATIIPPKTTLELDIEKYKNRADSKNRLMAKMAAMNVGRIKEGTWTVPQLAALMQDPQIQSLITHMETLSFELAISVVNSITNPLITSSIKTAWINELQAAL